MGVEAVESILIILVSESTESNSRIFYYLPTTAKSDPTSPVHIHPNIIVPKSFIRFVNVKFDYLIQL